MSSERNLHTALIGFIGVIIVAGIGGIGTYLTSRYENARLITELQIQREQAESSLRSTIFDQAVKSLLEKPGETETDLAMSRRLMRLELLALNFGDTLSLSPLFKEIYRDLSGTQLTSSTDREQIAVFRKRLTGLARRVASRQFSGVAVNGTEQSDIDVDLDLRGASFANGLNQFVWPKHQVEKEFGGCELDRLEEQFSAKQLDKDDEELLKGIRGRIADLECMQLDGATRKVEITVSSPDMRNLTAKIQLKIWDAGSCAYNYNNKGNLIIKRDFTLDFFNFPKVDNTRLNKNQRFSLIMEAYDIDVGKIELAAVVFPAEYASLSDRPGMKEAVKIMKDAMDAD